MATSIQDNRVFLWRFEDTQRTCSDYQSTFLYALVQATNNLLFGKLWFLDLNSLLFGQQLKKFHMYLIKFLSSAVKKLDVKQKFLNAYHYFQIITLFNCQTTGFLWLELRPIKKLIGSHYLFSSYLLDS